jgi:hypothetical protein
MNAKLAMSISAAPLFKPEFFILSSRLSHERLLTFIFRKSKYITPRMTGENQRISLKLSADIRFGLPAQPVDATLALNLCWGFEFRGLGRSLSWRATLFR